MAYPQLEELMSRKREKVALFLTAENMAGLLAIGLPAYIGTLGVSIWLRLLILFAAAVLGVALTSDVNGMACYERVLWWVRGRARRQMTQAVIRPAELTTVATMPGERALPLGGPLRRMHQRIGRLPDTPRLAATVRMAPVLRYQDTRHAPSPVSPVRVSAAVGGAGSGSTGADSGVDATPAVLVEHAQGNHL